MLAIADALEAGRNALRVRPCRGNSYELVSLWEMLRLKADAFVLLMQVVDKLRAASAAAEAGAKYEEHSYVRVLQYLAEATTLLDSLGMRVSRRAAEKSSAALQEFGGELAPAKWMLRHLTESIQTELETISLYSIPSHIAAYHGSQDLFGGDVAQAFPAASNDIEEAGSCLACGRWTASVFHLMRVLEHGLQKMAISMGIAQADSAAFSQWGELIKLIEDELDAARIAKKTPQKSFDLQRYSELALEFRYFKNAWRNHVMHARVSYDEEAATRIFSSVRDFMKTTAKVLT